MNKHLLTPEVQEFIKTYERELSELAFKGSPFKDITVQELIQQIDGFRRSKKKLPSWYATENIYYPPKLNIEQTSSEITAHYKSSLVKGERIADITGGFGVDSFYFANEFKQVEHFELNEELSKITAYNFKVFGKDHIRCSAKDGLKAIENELFDTIYIDPARRHDSKGKVFFLSDCEPNVPEHLEFLLARSKTILLKTSPMLDISIGLSELQGVAEVHVVAVDNEVKELLWLLKGESSTPLMIKTINFAKSGNELFNFEHSATTASQLDYPSSYLYEPNAAIMKSGGFMHISEKYNLKKLHKSSHLFTSDTLIEFPGRVFKIEKVIPYQKKELRKNLQLDKANITTRNFPESVSDLRKKLKIKDGGDSYLFFTTNLDKEKVVLVCGKLS